MKKIYTSDVFNLTKNFLAIPPLLFTAYAATKSFNNIDIEYFDKTINLLTSDLNNSITLGSLIAGTYLITHKEKAARVLGLTSMIGGTAGLLSVAITNNNLEPFFLSQNLILMYLSAKTIVNELSENKMQEKNIDLEKKYQNFVGTTNQDFLGTRNSKILKFLDSKKEAIKSGLKNFNEKFVNIIGKHKQTSTLLGSSFLLLSTYMLSKSNIDINLLKDNLDIICKNSYNFTAMTLTLYGSYKLSKNEQLQTGIVWTISNAMWFANSNSSLHELSTVLFAYNSSLLAFNSSKKLEKDNKLLSLNEYVKNSFYKFKKNIDKLVKKPISKEKEKG